MGIATGITAERMLELANGFLVSGHVDPNGNLILANGGGQTTNAGSVKGPQGDIGLKGDKGVQGDIGPKGADAAIVITPMSVTDAPSAYAIGISIFSISDATTNGAWPTWPGTVETIRHSVNRTIQIFAEKITGKTWIRTENDSNGWGSWNQTSYVGHTHAATDVTSGLLPSARLEDIVPRGRGSIGTPVDWNTLTVSGIYGVDALGANGPVATPAVSTGVLVVDVSVVNDKIVQTFYNHDGNWGMWVRTKQSAAGTWNAWVEIHNWGDIKRDLPAFFSDSGSTNWLPSRLQPAAQLIASGTDIRTIKNSGFYRGIGLTNAPAGSTDWWYYEIIRHDDSWVNYMAYDYHSARVYRGYWNNGVWQGWTMIVDSYGDTGYTDISGNVTLQTSISYALDAGAWGGLRARRVGGFVHMIIENLVVAANYWKAPGATGTNPTLPADGNIGNVMLLNGVPTQFRPPSTGVGGLSAGTAGNMNAMYVTPAGELYIAWIDGASDPTKNQTVSATGMYPGV